MFALKGRKGQGFKYKFTLSPLVLRLDDLFSDGEKVSFVWNRGSNNESAAIASGVARWTEGLVVICTLYRVGGKGPAAGSFFKKTAKVNVVAHLILLGATLGYQKSRRQVMITSVQNDRTTSNAAQRLAGKVLCSGKLNMGDFAGTEPVTEEVELALFSGKATRRGVVTVRVRSEWLTAAHPLLGSIGDRSSTSRDIFSEVSSMIGDDEEEGPGNSGEDEEKASKARANFPPRLDAEEDENLRFSSWSIGAREDGASAVGGCAAGKPLRHPLGATIASKLRKNTERVGRAADTGSGSALLEDGVPGAACAENTGNLVQELASLRASVKERDMCIHELAVAEARLRVEVTELRKRTIGMARDMTKMETLLYSVPAEAAAAEEAERLTAAFVPVIQSLTKELDDARALLRAHGLA